MSHQNKYPNPEFSIYMRKVPDIPVGRIYIPHTWTKRYELSHFYKSIHIIEEYSYMNGDKRIYFIAPIALYRSLADQFPHPKYSANTDYLLTTAYTFFEALEFFSNNSFIDIRLSLMLLRIVLFNVSLPPESHALLMNLVSFFILASQLCGFLFQLSHILPQHTSNSNTSSIMQLAG